ncbi:MAG TPA: hypothetical protein ENJ22_05420 [Gammaproteobacteria bacterium]|nr:hypothetical protein [Gammaproteobacteria bacterium]
MFAKKIVVPVSAALGLAIMIPAANAGGVTYGDGNKYMKLGGRIQLQYKYENPDSGDSTDSLFFRRLRPFIEGSLHPDWKGKFQWDMGKAINSNEIAIKDAYMEYSGFNNTKIKLGNYVFPFSREFVTSSKYQQFVERTFVGDHTYGTPDRNLGIHASGHNDSKKVTWGASFSSASIDPSNSKLDFDSPVNKDSDFNEGWMLGGRVDFHPFGALKFSQGDFKREQKATIGVAAFTWNNDGDNNVSPGKDVDAVTGYEISGAYRNKGFSTDLEYNRFDSELKDGTVTSGLYKNGQTTLENWMIKGGYMVMPGRLELVLGYSSQDADNYEEAWTRFSGGLNWFVHKHDVKYQLTYRQNSDKDGVKGNDETEIFAQAQYVF